MVLENNNTCSLDKSLITPVAAKSFDSIETYVGSIGESSQKKKWCTVQYEPLTGPNALPVWDHEKSQLIQQPLQCWVHVDYTGYRMRYNRTIPLLNPNLYVISYQEPALCQG